MKYIYSKGIYYHTREPELHNQNPAKGVIIKVRQKWYNNMLEKGTKSTMGIWCKLGIKGDVNDSLFGNTVNIS